MIDCLVIGDSIAVGVQQFRKDCNLVGKGGINTWQFNKMYPGNLSARNVIISLGTNDHKGVKTRQELESTRSRVDPGAKVWWVLPAIKPDIQEIVKEIAAKWGDTVLPIKGLQADGIHPSWAGYKDLGAQAR